MAHLPVLLCFLCSWVGVPAQEPLVAESNDWARIQGEWRARVRLPGFNRSVALTMQVRDETVRWVYRLPDEGSDRELVGRLELDPASRPKRWTLTEVVSDGRRLPDMRAIYSLEPDRLILGVPASPDDARPTLIVLDDGQGPPRSVVFRRPEQGP